MANDVISCPATRANATYIQLWWAGGGQYVYVFFYNKKYGMGIDWVTRIKCLSISSGRAGRAGRLLLLLLLIGESLVDGSAAAVAMLDGGDGRCAGRGAQVGGGRFAALALDEPDEDSLERPVENGVNERVDGGRHVAQPQTSGHQTVGDVGAARRPHHHQQVE